MTLFGNALVILAFKRNMKIRTVTNYFVVSLAVADILVALVSMPIWAAYLMSGVLLKEVFLKVWTFMDILCGVASIINLTAISIERFIFKTARFQARQIALMIKGNVKNFLLASEMRAAKTLAVVMGAFVISWGPFFIINIVYGFCDGCVTEQSVVVAKWMHYSNSVFNPIVYACMNKEFRKAFCIILFGRKRCCRPRGRNETTDQTELTLGTNI
ncbi:hypothetical protein pdam_00002129 [Pocillopora damicornis]|uniref:G-protein coupled receptors family 1 profile domain-containing protein n=1 Tax=Pocillopora damicornis TaxID=46731 RepID=A0A3M6U1U1_POCDA|nr:hypothetical protein pdam_00002129 [Pocillopora damicornis]